MKNDISNTFDAMGKGLFASLIIGIIFTELGKTLSLEFLVDLGVIAKFFMGPCIAISIAKKLNYQQMTTSVSVIVGAIGAGSIVDSKLVVGDPLLCLLVTSIVLYISNKIEKKRVFDIFLIPIISIVLAMFFYNLLFPISKIMFDISMFINDSITYFPIISAIFISLIFAVAISGPFSSAALAIILSINGQVAFVALCATSAQMVGFFIMGLKDNGFINSLLVLFGSSKLHLKNIVNNKFIFIPPLITSVIIGVISTFFGGVNSTMEAAGLGTCALVGQILTIKNNVGNENIYFIIIILNFILPCIICYSIYYFFRSKKLIKKGDLKLWMN
ncbi:MAG: PTS sugar transporter subunit IIC [Mycoplasmatales bacterium]